MIWVARSLTGTSKLKTIPNASPGSVNASGSSFGFGVREYQPSNSTPAPRSSTSPVQAEVRVATEKQDSGEHLDHEIAHRDRFLCSCGISQENQQLSTGKLSYSGI